MKKVFSLLTAFILFQTQAWALSGGPVFEGGGGVSLIGSYAGVLVPDLVTAGVDITPGADSSAATIGLFSLGVPDTGLAQGGCVIFVNGDPFSGTIIGVADPGKGTLTAVIDTISNFILVDARFPGIDFRLFATGQLEAEVFALPGSTSGTNALFGPPPGSTRLEGTATLEVTGGTLITYTVDGYKQSDAVNTTDADFFGGIGNNDDDDDNG